jgi:hypothetical protein
MAKANQPPSDFTTYYNLYKQRITSTLGAPPTAPVSFTGTPKEPEMGFLGGVIDFLSRPLYAVTNIANKALDLPERFEQADVLASQGKTNEALSERFKALGSVAVAPVTGLFAQDRENKAYTSDIIEKAADVAGRNNPNYVDVNDNVNPALKGTVGLAGDILFDPLTWVPAAWIAKGIATGGRGVQAVTRATKNVLGPQKTAEVTKGAVLGSKPVEDVIDSVRSNQSPIQNVGDVVNNNPVPAQASLKASTVIADSVARGELPSKTLGSALRSSVNSIKIKKGGRDVNLRGQMEKFITGLKLEKIVSPTPVPQRELSFNEWMTELQNFPSSVDLSDVPLGVSKVGTIELKKGNLQELVDKLDKLPANKYDEFFDNNQDSFVNQVLNPLYQRHVAGVRSGEKVDILGRPVPEAEILEGATAAVARLAELAGTELANAEYLFGADLIASLRRMNPERMAKFLDAQQNVLARNGVVEAVGSVRANSAEAKLLSRFDISPATLRAAQEDLAERINALRAGQGTKNLKTAVDNLAEDGNFVQQLADDLADANLGRDPRLVDDAVAGVVNALGVALRNFSDNFLRKKYSYEKYDGELLLTDPRYGAGDARVKDLYGTYVQNDYWTSLSKRARVLFAGFPARRGVDAPMALEGTIRRDAAGNVIYRGELPKYVNPKNYQAYAGFDIADALESYVLTTARAGEDVLAAKGFPITMDLKAPGAVRAIEHLRFSDMYRLLDAGLDTIARTARLDRTMHHKWLQLLFFHAGTGVSRTSLADALITMKSGGTREQVLDVLRSGTTRSGGKAIDNWLAGGTKEARFGFSRGSTKPSVPAGVSLEAKRSGDRIVGYYYKWSNDVAAENIVDALFASKNYIDDVITIRRNQYLARFQTEVDTVLPEISRNLVELMSNPVTRAGGLRSMNRTNDIVDDYISAIEGTEAASVYLKGIVESSIPATVVQAARSADKISTAAASGNKAAADKARAQKAKEDRKVYEENEAKAREAAEETLNNPNATPEDLAAAEEVIAMFNIADGYGVVQTGAQRFLQAFSATYRMDAANHIAGSIGIKSFGLRARKFKDNISQQVKAIAQNPNYNAQVDGKTPVLNSAMELIQAGTDAPPGTVLAAAKADLESQIGNVLDVTGKPGQPNQFLNSILGTTLLHTGASLDQLNSVFMKHMVLGKGADDLARLPEGGSFFDANLAVKDSKKKSFQDAAKALLPSGSAAEINEMAKIIAAMDQWKTWKIDNPRHFMLSVQTAMYELSAKVSFVDNMFDYAKGINLGTDDAVKASQLGFVKLVSEGDSYFGGVLPNNMYVAPEIAEMFQALDISYRTSRTLKGPIGDFTNKYLDKLLNTWKYSVTVIRPGHHIRNEIGGQSLRFAALGSDKFALAENKAYGLLALRKTYTDVDMWAALRADGQQAIKAGETLYSGKKFKIDADDAFRRMEENLFDVGRVVEDFFDEEIVASSFAKGVDVAANIATLTLAKRGGGVERIALGLSEWVEHKARAAHAIQAAMQMADGKAIVRGIGRVQKPKNMDELWQFAIESALKYHPNAASLTAFETKFPRRLFPFYSWFKPATVALLEASIMNPARTITAIPKASFNLAIAMGVDPYAVYYPFPEDQMFPSFLTEEMIGPQFEFNNRYVSVNPGFASLDIYNQLLTDPLEGVVQMVNPFARVPLEILAGSRLGSRAPIRDMSDYIDSSIPGVNYVSNITGRSVTGGFEPQRQVETGSKTGFDQGLSAFNWLSGLGVRNYSRSSYINFAEIEARNAAAQERQRQSFVDSFLGR